VAGKPSLDVNTAWLSSLRKHHAISLRRRRPRIVTGGALIEPVDAPYSRRQVRRNDSRTREREDAGGIGIAKGMARGIGLVSFEDRNVVLTHLHSGTIGWMTLGIVATVLWIYGRPRLARRRLRPADGGDRRMLRLARKTVVSTVVTLSERRGTTQASMTAIAMDRPVRDLSWGALLRVAAAAQSLGLGVAAVMLGDAEAGAIAVATIVMLVLQRFRGRTGAVLLGLLFADTAFFTGAAALSNLLDRATPQATIGPAALAAIALAGVVASIASVWQGRRMVSPGRSTTTTAFLVTAAFGIIAIASVVSTRGGAASGGDALPGQAPLPQAGPHPAAAPIQRLEIKGARFSTDTLAAASGTVTVAVTNHDLFWHTFTIGELGVDLRVPIGDEKSVTFTAAPGTYTYICAVPGHASFMRGVLTVP